MSVILGDSLQVLKTFEPESIDFCLTSPSPFGCGKIGIGSEKYYPDYINNLHDLFDKVYRVTKPTGCLWIQMSDYHTQEGRQSGIPEKLMTRLNEGAWILRSKCIWVRTEKFEMQEDYGRFARDWEYLYFFTKSKNHYFNNPRQKVQSSVFYADYKAPRKQEFESGFPEKIIERCISLSCPKNGTILDPLSDAGTTGVVAKRMGRPYILIEIEEWKTDAMKARLEIT